MDDEVVILSDVAFEKKPSKSRYELVKPVVEYTRDGQFVASYSCLKEASKATGIHSTTIRGICCGINLHTWKNTGERIFLYRGDDINVRLKKIEERYDEYKSLHPRAVSKPVCEYTLGGRFLFKYPAIKEAAIVNKVSSNLIHNCIKGKRLYIDKHIFLFPEDDIKERVKLVKAELYRLSKKRPKYREVDVYSSDGKFIKAYPSASAASRDMNIHVSDITRCCNGGDKYFKNRLTAKGYIFLWVGGSISERLEQIELLKQSKK